MSPERLALRAAIDRAVRDRVERENECLRLCSGCQMPMSDWTPGCHQCWNRHRNYETKRTRCPYPIDASFWNRMRVVSERWAMENLRANGRKTGPALHTYKDAA